MSNSPKIQLGFTLTKKDGLDFDRERVTEILDINPTDSEPPKVSNGTMFFDSTEFDKVQYELSGLTIIPNQEPPYKYIINAFWSIETTQTESCDLESVLKVFEKNFHGKEKEISEMCKECNLTLELTIRIFSESDNLPILCIPNDSIMFWASIGASIDFDMRLD